MVSNPIICCSAMHWVLTPRGMPCPQRKKTAGAVRPLERGLEHTFAETDQHGTRLVRCNTAMREHGETDTHQARNQVAGHGCSGVVEDFVLGLDLTDVTAKVTNQSVGDVRGSSALLNTPMYAPQDLWISNGCTKGV